MIKRGKNNSEELNIAQSREQLAGAESDQALWASGEQGWGQPGRGTGSQEGVRGGEGLLVLGRWPSGASTRHDPDPRQQPARAGHTSWARFVPLPCLYRSKWQCLLSLVAPLVSKQRLTVGWSRGWGCQPRVSWQGRARRGEGRAPLPLSCGCWCLAQEVWHCTTLAGTAGRCLPLAQGLCAGPSRLLHSCTILLQSC